MKLADILGLLDYEHSLKVLIEINGTIGACVSGNQTSIVKMLSDKMLETDVSCIAARDGNVLYIWLEEVKR